jgi:hypothetical protein
MSSNGLGKFDHLNSRPLFFPTKTSIFPNKTEVPIWILKSSDKTQLSHSITGVATMKLAFLGQAYEASFPSIEIADTNAQLTFLGRPYLKKQAQISHRQPSTSELIYRGVRYLA